VIEDVFSAPEMIVNFLHALGGNTHLERLALERFEFDGGVGQAFATGLGENGGLVHLGVSEVEDLDESFFRSLMGAISKHPSLRTLEFQCIGTEENPKCAAFAKAVSEMLSINNQVEEISLDEEAFYRKRCAAMFESVRAAVVARALVRVESKPSLLYMLLTCSREIISILSDPPRMMASDLI
jgi:hypothetical protein